MRHLSLVVLLFAVPLWARAQNADPLIGRNLAATCANCHSTTTQSASGIPGLAGRQKAELAALLRDFKNGNRPGTVMNQLAKGYSDAQINAVAEYYASTK